MNAAPTLQVDPTNPMEIARTHLWQKNPKDAIPLLLRAIAERPNDGNAHHLLGCALIETGEKSKAIAHLQEALTANPKNIFARLDLVRALQL